MAVATAPDKVIQWKLLKDRVRLIRAMLSYISSKAWFDPQSIEMSQAISRIRKDESKHFLSYSQEEGGKVSYASKPEYKYDNVHRYKTTLSRYLRRQLGITQDTLPDRYIERMSYDVFGLLISQDVVPITLTEGQKIMDAYEHGVGGESCMTGDYAKYTELYAENPDKVQLAIYSNGRKARALLWNTDEGKKVLDRIYPNEGSHVRAMQEWAVSNGYVYRPYTGMGDNSLSDDKRYHVTLKATDYCPYMDTFNRGKYDGNKNTVILSNDNHFGSFTLERTNGSPPWSNSYCDKCDNDYYREDGVHIRDIDEYWCQRCANRHTYQCDECGEYNQEDCVHTEDTDKTYCQSCAGHKCIVPCLDCSKYYEEGIDECSDGQSRCIECREQWEEGNKDREEEAEEAHETSAKRRPVAATR